MSPDDVLSVALGIEGALGEDPAAARWVRRLRRAVKPDPKEREALRFAAEVLNHKRAVTRCAIDKRYIKRMETILERMAEASAPTEKAPSIAGETEKGGTES